jgi:hypothetical protein
VEVKKRWHESRVHERGSRSSAQQIFRIIKRRLLAGEASLPPITRLAELAERCPTDQAKAQLFYFFLIQEDDLFRFVLHEVLRQQGVDRKEWDLSSETLGSVLSAFQYSDGSGIEYADSTLHRWVQGFRSVLRDVGVIKKSYDQQGQVPTVDLPPLDLSSLYSLNERGPDWAETPIGWYYLFQPPSYHDILRQRLLSNNQWKTVQLRGQTVIRPINELSES